MKADDMSFGTVGTTQLPSIEYPQIWKPKPDITIYELALCMPVLVALVSMWRVDRENMLAALPAFAKRHFDV